MTRTRLRQELRIRNQRLGKALTWLQDQGTIQHTPSGWQVAHNVKDDLMRRVGRAEPDTPPVGLAQHTEESRETDTAPNQQAFPFPPIGGQGNGTKDAKP